MKFVLIALGLVGLALAAPSSSPINPALLKTLAEQETATVIISFKETNLEAARSQVRLATYASRGAKITDLVRRLRNHGQAIAKDVIAHLEKTGTPYEHLYITNQIVLRNTNLAVVKSLGTFSEIKEIRQTKLIQGPAPLNARPYTGPLVDVQWGVVDVKAPEAWARNINGTGVVVATIDTGVRGTHEALSAGKRSSYNWFEPGTFTDLPHDVVGHGTHVTGTIAGRTRGVGVANRAEWIACLGCRAEGCFEEDLTGCGQWVLCPTETDGTREDCSQAPRIVSNSWGGGNEDPFYDEVMKSWVEADIVPVFAIGNAGPLCSTANSPGDSEIPISVGSINNLRHTSTFSSRGPTKITGRIQPDIAAPGTDITSSYFLTSTSYYTMSGTSMATPHAAGVIALLLEAEPSLTVAELKEFLYENAVPHDAIGALCKGVSDRVYPNNQVGHGLFEADVLLDALAARKAQK